MSDSQDLLSSILDNVTTLHFDREGLTYTLTKCEGANCVAITDFPWFAVYNGRKRISSNFCDKGIQSSYAFEFKRTKQGQLNGDALLSIKNGKTRFVDLPNRGIPDWLNRCRSHQQKLLQTVVLRWIKQSGSPAISSFLS